MRVVRDLWPLHKTLMTIVTAVREGREHVQRHCCSFRGVAVALQLGGCLLVSFWGLMLRLTSCEGTQLEGISA